MAILAFQKPDKVIMLESDEFHGKFEFRPLEPGYGMTVGNALRRVLLSSLEGFAITSIKIDSVDHEFSTIEGVMEDVSEIVLQLKQVRFKQQIEDVNQENVTVNISGQEEFRAGDIGKFLTGFKILNPDLLICRMESSVNLRIELNINKGRGYVTAEENKPLEAEIGVIPIGSIFTPIKNVKYFIENMRVEQKTDFEKLIFEIETDGSINPKDALKEAATILIYHLMLFSDEKITLDSADKNENEEFDEEVLRMRQLLKTKLVDLDLSVRALNCLKAAEVETLGELVQFNKSDLLKFRNFGKKSLTELENLLDIKNLNFGMDTSKYKLDKE
jgi:DNA-directed RNA polymerase subunit alpha